MLSHENGLVCYTVALREEGVDRNSHIQVFNAGIAQSPSARRAWIEIKYRKA